MNTNKRTNVRIAILLALTGVAHAVGPESLMRGMEKKGDFRFSKPEGGEQIAGEHIVRRRDQQRGYTGKYTGKYTGNYGGSSGALGSGYSNQFRPSTNYGAGYDQNSKFFPGSSTYSSSYKPGKYSAPVPYHANPPQSYPAPVNPPRPTAAPAPRPTPAPVPLTTNMPVDGLSFVKGVVWKDTNVNGIKDNDEVGVPGAKVFLCEILLVRDGKKVGGCLEDTTDNNGQYAMSTDGSEAPEFFVGFELPPGFVEFAPLATSNRAIANDANNDGRSAEFPTPANGVTKFINAGIVPVPPAGGNGGIEGVVWEDTNANGRIDADEPRIPNVNVIACENFGDAVGGGSCQETTTNTDGKYLIRTTGSSAPFFVVQFVPPEEFSGFTHPGLDSDVSNLVSGTTSAITSPGKDARFVRDAGLVRPVLVGGVVWEDRNFDGIRNSGEPGISGATVLFCEANGGCLAGTTNDDGLFVFDPSGSPEPEFFLGIEAVDGLNTISGGNFDATGRTANFPKPDVSNFSWSAGLSNDEVLVDPVDVIP